MKNVVIIGVGAIGSVYATAFTDAGIPVRIAVDPERKTRYENNGIFFNGKEYKFDYFVPSTTDQEADLIIIATKSWTLHDALDVIEPIIGSHTQILPLLNGVTSEKICADRYGWDRVLYGFFMGHTATRKGNIITQDGIYTTSFGEAENLELTTRVKNIATLFGAASIPYENPENMLGSLWEKFVLNIGVNQATAILRCRYEHLQNNYNAHKYMLALMQEAAMIAEAKGIGKAQDLVEKSAAKLNILSPNDGSSMYQDVINNSRSEFDIFAETVCRLGEKYNIPTPFNYHAAVILKALY